MLSTVSEPPRAPRQPRRSTTATSSCVTVHRPPAPDRPRRRGRVAAFLRGLSPRRGGSASSGRSASGPRGAALVERGTGLVAVAGLEETVVAHASSSRRRADRAELAVAVATPGRVRHRHPAAGTPLSSPRRGHRDVRRCIRLTAGCFGCSATRASPSWCVPSLGVLKIELPSQLGQEAIDHFEERDRIGAVAAVRHVLEPSSIAVIARSRRRVSVGGTVVRNLVAGVRRADLSGQPAREDHRRPASLRIRRRRPRTRGTGRHRRPRAACGGGRAGMRAQGVRASWCSPAASANRARRARRARRSCLASAVRRACGSSGRTASVCSTWPRRCSWTPRSRPVVRPRAGSRALRRAAPRDRRARRRRAPGPSAFVVRLDGQQG